MNILVFGKSTAQYVFYWRINTIIVMSDALFIVKFSFVLANKAWESTRETYAKHCLENKIQIDQIVCDLYYI